MEKHRTGSQENITPVEALQELAAIFNGGDLELKSDENSKVVKEKFLEDEYVLRIESESSDGLEIFNVGVSKERERLVEFSIDSEGTRYLGLFAVALKIAKWPTSTSFSTYRFFRKEVKDARFAETAGILVNWTKQIVDTNQFIQPPIRAEVLGF